MRYALIQQDNRICVRLPVCDTSRILDEDHAVYRRYVQRAIKLLDPLLSAMMRVINVADVAINWQPEVPRVVKLSPCINTVDKMLLS